MRYHGTLAPNARVRGLVVPRSAATVAPSDCTLAAVVRTEEDAPKAAAPVNAATAAHAADSFIANAARVSGGVARASPSGNLPGHATPAAGLPMSRGGSLVTARGGGSRLDWATLLERVHGIDALKCARCDAGRLEFIAVITDRRVARRILEHVGEWAEQGTPRRHVLPVAIDFDVPPPYD